MRLWVDIYDAAGNRLGAGPIGSAVSASVTRKLDAAGSFRFECPLTDERALSLIQSKRRARVFVENQGVSRELVRGIIEKIGSKDSNSGWRLSPDGPDSLEELKFASVLLGRKYDNQSVNAVVDDLLGLTPGWLRSGDEGAGVSARFDGVSVLKALQSLMSQQGLHFRSSTPGTLEIGTFGQSNGLRIVNAVTASSDLYTNDDILLIENFSLVEDSEDITNWLIPLGAGQGDAALTLEKSTRSTAGGFPYDIQTLVLPDGRAGYYIEDSASEISYGPIQKVGTFKHIAPISNSEESLVNAANALYDAAAAWLQRYSQPYQSYSVTVRKVRTNIQPGDLIHLRYKGLITNSNGEVVTYRNISDDFWVLEVRETFDLDGASVTLKIASIDRYEMDAARIVLGALEEIKINNVSVAPYFANYFVVYVRDIDSTHDAVVPVYVTNAVQKINRCLLRLTTRPLRATATSAQSQTSASGGGSTTSSGGGQTSSGSGILNTGLETKTNPPSMEQHYHSLSSHTHTVSDHSHTVSSHTHSIPAASLNYGIEDDTDTPDTVRIEIDGTDYTSALGGPWFVGGGGGTVELEISDQINVATPLQQTHEITITCDSGQGTVEAVLEVYPTIQSISIFN